MGAGIDHLLDAVARVGHESELENGRSLGVAASAAGSRGDGTLPLGDHDFKRVSGHVQVFGDQSETNRVLGYQDKF